MSWDAIGAIGQAVGALALVFVLMQVRHAREEMRRTATLTRLHGTRDLQLAQATDGGALLSAMEHAHAAAGGMSPAPPAAQYLIGLGLNSVETARVISYQMAVWQNYEASIESIRHLSPGVRWEVDNSIRNNFTRSVIAGKWFELSKARLNPYAVRYVEDLLAQTD